MRLSLCNWCANGPKWLSNCTNLDFQCTVIIAAQVTLNESLPTNKVFVFFQKSLLHLVRTASIWARCFNVHTLISQVGLQTMKSIFNHNDIRMQHHHKQRWFLKRLFYHVSCVNIENRIYKMPCLKIIFQVLWLSTSLKPDLL